MAGLLNFGIFLIIGGDPASIGVRIDFLLELCYFGEKLINTYYFLARLISKV